MKLLRLLFLLLLIPSVAFGWGTGNEAYQSAAVSGGDTISHVGTSSASASSSATITVDVPSGTSTGNKMILCVQNDSGTSIWTDPTGWGTPIETTSGGSNFNTQCYERLASSEPSDYTITSDSIASKTAHISVFSKSGGTWATTTTNDTEDTTSPSMTTDSLTSIAGGVMLSIWVNDGAETVDTAPSGVTAPTNSYIAGNSSATVVYYEATASSSSYSRSITWTGSEQMGAIQIAIGLSE